MTGRIINYNAGIESGLVESEQSESYSFSGEVWGGSDLPQTGQLVDFETFWTFADSVTPARATGETGMFEAFSNIFKTTMNTLQPMGVKAPVSPSFGRMFSNKTSSDKVPSDKSKIAVFFLALFFGMYGVHKFYLGYVIPGLIHIAAIIVMVGLMVTGSVTLMTIGLVLAFLIFLVPSVEAWIYLSTSREKFRVKYVESRHPWF